MSAEFAESEAWGPMPRNGVVRRFDRVPAYPVIASVTASLTFNDKPLSSTLTDIHRAVY